MALHCAPAATPGVNAHAPRTLTRQLEAERDRTAVSRLNEAVEVLALPDAAC